MNKKVGSGDINHHVYNSTLNDLTVLKVSFVQFVSSSKILCYLAKRQQAVRNSYF
ncbi:MAG: hypothetical protein U0V04_12065 [Spirosomataceae bacterium]